MMQCCIFETNDLVAAIKNIVPALPLQTTMHISVRTHDLAIYLVLSQFSFQVQLSCTLMLLDETFFFKCVPFRPSYVTTQMQTPEPHRDFVMLAFIKRI